MVSTRLIYRRRRAENRVPSPSIGKPGLIDAGPADAPVLKVMLQATDSEKQNAGQGGRLLLIW
jgi:hypothetical protein